MKFCRTTEGVVSLLVGAWILTCGIRSPEDKILSPRDYKQSDRVYSAGPHGKVRKPNPQLKSRKRIWRENKFKK